MAKKILSKENFLDTFVVSGSVCVVTSFAAKNNCLCYKQPRISTELCDNYTKIKFKSKDILFYVFSLLWLQMVDFILFYFFERA